MSGGKQGKAAAGVVAGGRGRVSRRVSFTPVDDGSPLIARLVMRRGPVERSSAASTALLAALGKHWPTGMKVTFLVTPGGFLTSDAFPLDWDGKSGWASTPQDIQPLYDAAARLVSQVLSPQVKKALRGKVTVLTLGIDLTRESGKTSKTAELVAVYDVAKDKVVQWTGKSYPTSTQERALVQEPNLSSHQITIAGERVLILGCHDLNMFSARGRSTQSANLPRRRRCNEMRMSVDAFQPTVVLQHPHRTDSPRIWLQGWAGLRKGLKLRAWASGIAFLRLSSGRLVRPRSDISEVLDSTGQSCMNIIL